MKDDLTVSLIDSINLNPNITPAEKLELVAQTLRDCKQKKIGKIVMDAIENKAKKDGFYPDGPLKRKTRKKTEHSAEFLAKKELTENQKNLLKVTKADNEGRY